MTAKQDLQKIFKGILHTEEDKKNKERLENQEIRRRGHSH